LKSWNTSDPEITCQLENIESSSSPIGPLELRLIETKWSVIRYIHTGGINKLMKAILSDIRQRIYRRLFKKKRGHNPNNTSIPHTSSQNVVLNLKPGEVVQVLSKEEILATLDSEGKYQRLAFMKEMFKFCGKKFRVLKRIDTMMVEGVGLRHIPNSVILEGVFCDGEYHGGCQRTCYCIWREGWLRKVR